MEMLAENRNPDLRMIDWRAAMPYVGLETKVTVRAGMLSMQGRKWYLGKEDETLKGDALMGAIEKVSDQVVDVRYFRDHEHSISKAMIYYGGKYICDAVP